jgi:metallo-beta-lactamase class B
MKSLFTGAAAAVALTAAFVPNWNHAFPPHRVAGNLYYVGTNFLSSYLVTTPEGHILINPSFEPSVPLIQASVEKLGFKFSDVKVILISHAHDDHCAGTALAKKLTGAKVMVMAADVPLIEHGGAGDFQYDSRWAPVKVDRVLHDGDTVSLGGSVLTAHLTAGHTKGCTTWTMKVADGGKTYNVVIVGSPNVNEGYRLVNNPKYPEMASDFANTFKVLKSLPCDIFLGAHGNYYGMEEKLKRAKTGAENPFVDPDGYRTYVAERQKAYESELAKQRAGK